MILTFSYFIQLNNSRVCYQFTFSQSKTFSNMTEVGTDEDNGIGTMESNEEYSVMSWWKFRNSITLPRSEVVFFTQATLSFILLIASLLKLTLDRPPCEEKSVWSSLLFGAVGYLLLNPKL